MVVGLRVIRGPDWDKGDKDGGQDHLGTVACVTGDEQVEVVWDMGEITTCRVGKGGKHDIIVFDNAPLGLTHRNVGCESCEEVCITGTLWKCAQCDNVNLCTACYYSDGHDTKHPFKRIDFPGTEPVEVPKRTISQKSRSLGIFPSSDVVRGKDWEYDEQDGGKGRIGKVEDVVSYGKDLSSRNAVRVKWPNNHTSVYRLGYQGKVDVRCMEETPGPDFYKEHLAFIDLSKVNDATSRAEILSVGDRVCVHVSGRELRQLQHGRLIWNNSMAELTGEIGILKNITIDGHLEVQFEDRVFILNKGAVTKVPEFKVGDVVKTVQSKELLKRLLHNHGGWDDDILKVIGKAGVVTIIDKDGDIGVRFSNAGFVFHPNCLIHADEEPVDGHLVPALNAEAAPYSFGESSEEEEYDEDDEEEEQEEEDDGDEEKGAIDAGEGFLQMFAGLVLLHALAEATETTQDNKEEFLNAVVQGKDEDVKRMLQANSSLCQLVYRGLPTLHLAAHQGHVEVTRALLQAGIPIDIRDNEKKNTALIVAVAADKTIVAKVLIENGADVDCQNIHGRTALHIAAVKNMAAIVEALLDRNCDPNIQDVAGDTALHDAIGGTKDEAAGLLIASPKMNLKIQNKKMLNPLAFACMKGHHFALDKMLTRDMSLANIKASNGHLPLHIAAINNNVNEARTLIIKARADVDAKNDLEVTPLHLACSEAFFAMVELLLTHGANWDAVDKDGDTPLHFCMAGRRSSNLVLAMFGVGSRVEDNERIKIANLLIQHGAKIDVENKNGKTPILACSNVQIRDAVKTFAENHKPTKLQKRETRPKTPKVVQEAFTTFSQKCHKCAKNMVDTRFLPCKHTISCTKCCFKYKICSICDQVIASRVDKDGKTIQDSGCVIS